MNSSFDEQIRIKVDLSGGGYAEYVAVPEDLLLPVPDGMPLATAAAIPEVWLTAYQLMHFAGRTLFLQFNLKNQSSQFFC